MFLYQSFFILLLFIFIVSCFFISNYSLMIFSWKINLTLFYVDLDILLSIWNILFLFLVLLISLSVLIFSIAYMNHYHVKYFLYLYFMFVFSMLWLILNTNFYWMMLGWDGLGVVSFLLIIYYMSTESINNGLFTLFQNRVGDVFFVWFILLSFSNIMTMKVLIFSGFLVLMLGASVKSAQFPFNSWLLAAMSAPTPISSLVHSSTLVVAGVYILLQYSYCLVDCLYFLKYLSVLTLIVSSFGLINESDMKKLIAYSTMSHVALMMFLLSHQLFKVVYFHLNIHAMFKSLMFMCFGFLMLHSFHSQDKRVVSYMNLNPVIKMCYYFSCLCLSGLPFLSAFFSKDFIIEKMIEHSFDLMTLILMFFFLSLSIYYSLKLFSLYHPMYTIVMVEKQYLTNLSLIVMMLVSVVFVNLYISLLFSLSYELISFKFFVYLIIFLMVFLSLLTNLNYKWDLFAVKQNFFESKLLSVYFLDMYVYNVIINLMALSNKIYFLKMILLLNWWLMICLVMMF